MKNLDDIILVDINEEAINIDDIVTAVNKILNKETKYKYIKDNRGFWLFKLYENGQYFEDDLGNIKVDSGVRLVNEDEQYWIKYKE